MAVSGLASFLREVIGFAKKNNGRGQLEFEILLSKDIILPCFFHCTDYTLKVQTLKEETLTLFLP